MSDIQNKPLVIDVESRSVPSGTPGQWTDFSGQMEAFTGDIIIPKFDLARGNISQIVSGMPSVFSRANLFKLAMKYAVDDSAEVEGLLRFYQSLIDEWRGLIACIALEPNHIKVKRIKLEYSDGKSIDTTDNIYEPKGAFGNVLFERKILWSQQGLSENEKENPTPFLDVIIYKDQVVGATSPESLFFTSVSYTLENENQPFVKEGRFTDPLKSDIKPEDLKNLFGYLKVVENGLGNFVDYYHELPTELRPQKTLLNGTLSKWINAIKARATEKGIDLDNAGAQPVEFFQEPFSRAFNCSDKLYGVEGKISDQNNLGDHSIAFNSKDLLLPKESEITRFNFGNKAAQSTSFLDSQPVHVLKAETKGMPGVFNYFALPLSIQGLNVFGNTLEELLKDNKSNSESSLTAIYDSNKLKDNLDVTLRVVSSTGQQLAPITETYTVSKSVVLGEDILIWPDFISKQWNRYFLYSEIPHNQTTTSATPFLIDVDDMHNRALVDEKGNPVLATAIPDNYKDRITTKIKVLSDNRVAGSQYQYEIFESSIPFKGLQFKSGGKDSGYVLIRYSAQNLPNIPSDDLSRQKILTDADLGIDFGSTNTSIAYYSINTSERGDVIKFKNRRVSLLGNDNKDNTFDVACENEIFFFQNDEINSNEIKSILTLHDQLRIPPYGSETQVDQILNKAIVGGFPNFEKNLPINSATSNRYNLVYPKSGAVDVVYNMKWAENPIEQAHKAAFVSSLLLQVYAELFNSDHVPVNLKWSLPSAMGNNIRRDYNVMWGDIKNINPIVGGKDLQIREMPYSGEDADEEGWGQPADTNQGGWNQNDSTQQNNGWGTSNTANDSWGSSSAGNSGWGNQSNQGNSQSSGVNIVVPSGEKVYNFVPIDPDKCLTESTAVANYWANHRRSGIEENVLTISFDIGGSTSDISALIMSEKKFCLIKQHSIRFAAQRISQAIRHSQNFEAVLLTTCQRHSINIQGLNIEPKKYSPETSSYYFEQIVDRLGPSELDEFYKLLASKCPELMSVNLYVTGLIAFYSGQLAVKMIDELRSSKEKPLDVTHTTDWFPYVQVVFAGKGARIFDWFGSISESDANKYYMELFVSGMGGMQNASKYLKHPSHIRFNDPMTKADPSEVKCEVAKGLAVRAQNLMVPSNNSATEIIGEDGFTFRNSDGSSIDLEANSDITPAMLETIGGQLKLGATGSPCPMFMAFCKIFQTYASQYFSFKMAPAEFMNALNNMNIGSYIRSLPEYRKAQENGKKFDFVAPIIVLEAMKFYEDHLIPNIAR